MTIQGIKRTPYDGWERKYLVWDETGEWFEDHTNPAFDGMWAELLNDPTLRKQFVK